MTLLLVVVGLAIVAGVAVLVVRDRPLLDEDPQARPMSWPPADPLRAEDLADARFTVVVRGYRMDEVDRVLDDARAALVQRDARIADLEAVVAVLTGRSGQGAAAAQPAGTVAEDAEQPA